MAVGKEIRTQINSIQNTQKITGAMQMVAASKMRKAQDRMSDGKPYSRMIRRVVSHLAKAQPEYKHPYMVERFVHKVGYIVVSTDRGLCGGLNTNMFKATVSHIKEMQERDGEKPLNFCALGSKAGAFFRRYGGNLLAAKNGLGEQAEAKHLIGSIKVMLDAYTKGEIDRLYIVYNRFVNTMSQTPVIEQLLPLPHHLSKEEETLAGEELDKKQNWDYLYEPEPKDLLNNLLVRYIESQVYQAVVENNACEQSARMVAMKNATENAGEMINQLNLVYNKARQAAITQEIAEIVGGAAAV